MLTKNEITSLNLSPTKKDFVQIWNELLEVAGRLSERWDPTSTNESDPGIVILKALTGIADKLNYNIDKNTLEAFMPTAAQEDSMRKLCEMLGYNIKYYRSAETTAKIKYHNANPSEEEKAALKNDNLYIPKFTVLTNSDQDINYFTIDALEYPAPAHISAVTPYATVKCMEGQIVQCESINDNNVITINQIADNGRFYMPEYQIAENGIFVYNMAADGTDGTPWKKVDNLNIQARGTRVFKFGYDSYEGRPYIEFPEDYSELVNDGLFIYYARTSGASGNISPGTLTQIELPTEGDWANVSAESFSVENAFSATTGANIETIGQAYNNFKKTIGTFETLVTCRDYMNKIYRMTSSSTGKPYVSNVLATDIRSDLNRAITICSCDDAGIYYKDISLTSGEPVSLTTKPVFNADTSKWYLGATGFELSSSTDFIKSSSSPGTTFSYSTTGEVGIEDGYWTITQEINSQKVIFKTKLTVGETKAAIDHFDLVLYPFKSYNQIKGNVRDIQEVYDASFKMLDKTNFNIVTDLLDATEVKTIAHNIKAPEYGDILSINNYLRLNAIIGTNSKITSEEGILLIEVIKIALANAFNMRELDFGEEIPFESIVEVIQNADPRIKVVSLAEPALYTTFSVLESHNNGIPEIREYAVASDWLTQNYADTSGRFEYTKADGSGIVNTFDVPTAKKIYNRLAVRNILAGRTPLFKYNTDFTPSFSEGAYKTTDNISADELPDGLRPSAGAARTWSARATGNDFTPSRENPCTVKYDKDSDTTYTGQWLPVSVNEINTITDDTAKGNLKSISSSNKGPVTVTYNSITYTSQWDDQLNNRVYGKIVYTKTAIPKIDGEEARQYPTNGIITKTNDDITKIKATCKINADKNELGQTTSDISNVTLENGEFIKFRAPNFITDKTFPAYVNYHLHLGSNMETEGEPAIAHTLADLLNDPSGGLELDAATKDTRRQAVLDYFGRIGHKKTFSLTQKIDKNGFKNEENQLAIENPTVEESNINISEILRKSGFVKLVDKKATLKWDTSSGDTKPNGDGPSIESLGIPVLPLANQFIISSDVFNTTEDFPNSIPNVVNRYLADIPEEKLPKNCDWTISYQFEYVPFEAATLKAWASFLVENCENIFGFKPVEERGTMLWRTYGDGYEAGKYIISTTSKLMPLTSGHLGLIADLTTVLYGVYVVEYLGADAKANFISNNEEYMLREGEKLYIEYTPSTTTEEGTTQDQEPVKEVYGPGTIIKPNGFENGLMDSAAYSSAGNTPHKTITFDSIGEIALFSLGANEQIEMREFAKVGLNKESLPAIYVYKNFNNCPILEVLPNDGSGFSGGNRINSSYTLKDGEYVFYTDQNKSEFAYFTAGTEVTLTGNTVLPRFEIIDIATIFDNGIENIPWELLPLKNSDGIIFQEFQYITLGSGDTLNKLSITDTASDCLTADWKSCDNVSYTVAGSTTPTKLPKINVSDAFNGGNGWEVCSILELSVSPTKSQALRSTAQVETSIELKDAKNKTITTLSAKDSVHPVSFKTNLACQSSTGELEISDVYLNPDNIKSFDVKVFAEETPSIIKTLPGSLAPYQDIDNLVAKVSSDREATPGETGSGTAGSGTAGSGTAGSGEGGSGGSGGSGTAGSTTTDIINPLDISKWDSSSQLIMDTFGSNWQPVALSSFSSAETAGKYDNALKLSAVIVPNTYGIFSIYLQYGDESKDPETWIETLPGVPDTAVTLFNVEESKIKRYGNKLYLNPGVNCVRINKTSDLFIKTAALDGAMYFDTIRLVDCSPLEYVKEGNTIKQYTQGLNMSQIGYLDTEASFNIIDANIRKKLKAEATNTALFELNSISDRESKKCDTLWSQVQESKAKFEVLADKLSSAETEITKFNSLAVGQQTAIKNNYATIVQDLTTEKALKEAINNNASTDKIELQLASLLTKLSGTDESQNILEELDKLVQTSYADIDTFIKTKLSESAILSDFKTVYTTSDAYITAQKSTIINDLKLASIKEIDNVFAEQFSAIEEAIIDARASLANPEDPSEEDYRTIKKLEDLLVTYQGQRKTELDKAANFNALTSTAILDLPYYKKAILEVWPNYIKQKAIQLVEDAAKTIRDVADGTDETTSSLPNKSGLLCKIVDYTAFEDLFNLITAQVEQFDARDTLITNVSKLINPTSDLSTKLTNLKDHARNTVLAQKIKDYLDSNNTVIEKQQRLQDIREELDNTIEFDSELLEVCAKLICPSILLFNETDEFYSEFNILVSYLKANVEQLTNYSDTITTAKELIEGLLVNALSELDLDTLASIISGTTDDYLELDEDTYVHKSLLMSNIRAILADIKDSLDIQADVEKAKETKLLDILQQDNITVAWQTSDDKWLDDYGREYIVNADETEFKVKKGLAEIPVIIDYKRRNSGTWYAGDNTEILIKESVSNWYDTADSEISLSDEVNQVLETLYTMVDELGKFTDISEEFKDTYRIFTLEERLLDEIRTLDKNRDFYYTVPIDTNLAIDFNEGDGSLNTLMNPAVNYDINNVNNNFVISKIDINYLTKGIQIARSSRLS